MIRVEQVEPLIADLSLKPFGAGRRVWVIPEVESLPRRGGQQASQEHRGAARDVYFLLVTDRLERVLPTIVSRCQLVEFQPLERRRGRGVPARASMGSRASRPRRWRDSSPGRSSAPRGSPATRAARDAARDYLRAGGDPVSASRSAAEAASAAAFIGVLEAHRPRCKAASPGRPGAPPRRARAAVPGEARAQVAAGRRRRRERKREEARLAPSRPRRTPSTCSASWVRDLWVVACGASDVLCNCDRAGRARRRGRGARRSTTRVCWRSRPRRARICISTSIRSSRCRRCSRASRRSQKVPRIASVVFRGGGKVYQFDAGDLELAAGDRVVVDTTRGAELRPARQGPGRGAGRPGPARPEEDRPQGHAQADIERRRLASPRPSARPSAPAASSSPSSAST